MKKILIILSLGLLGISYTMQAFYIGAGRFGFGFGRPYYGAYYRHYRRPYYPYGYRYVTRPYRYINYDYYGNGIYY